MTLKDVLAKHHISAPKWELFIKIAQANIRLPERKKGEKAKDRAKHVQEYLKTAPAWAYVGGMRDALWAWVGGDRQAYDVLEQELTKASQKRIGEEKGKASA